MFSAQMLSSLTVKPLLIAVAILSVTAAGLGWHVANLYERIGAAKQSAKSLGSKNPAAGQPPRVTSKQSHCATKSHSSRAS